ncbi:type I polyketide synthase [Ruegeria arenilitoris]|uniref:type I polyketide synthase n=1 Tax=Ruegeria arenilitoris TaxID=1173585 RepID=UPI00147D98FE|nr:type I polyketide synthase [Ruegeria arenilitoris]
MDGSKVSIDVRDGDIAIVGMAAHLPGAGSIETFWSNLRNGIESIREIDKQTLLDSGEAPHLLERPDYVPFAAPLDGFDQFDAEFFGLSPKEAAIMDPQHRQLLEVAWEALENAGHPPENFPGPIGVFAGCGMGSYFYFNVCSNPDLVEDVGMFLLRHTGNDKDFLSTRVSHILDLKGPSVNVQTACSTSLVAAHYAVQALMTGECDMALAGGVTIELPQNRGYIYKEGEVLSPDGQCHAFDHRAQGTVFGSGAGMVVLRRLSDALEDGDHIWSVIRGTAINNDGSDKAGYLAPSVDGQAAAIAEAHLMADVKADTIDYVECHGTGTYLGDPIEVAALTKAFSETSQKKAFCRLGSVKTNIGHLDTAAGVASLIKASLSLHNRQLPPSLGYEKPNPAIDFDHSPFLVNDQLTDWVPRNGPRRAGVNSLGVGGTNAHAILQEAPARSESDQSDWPFQLLTLSARGKKALDRGSELLTDHLRSHPDQDLADIAWTLKEGRRGFEKRRVLVAENHDQAIELLQENDPRRVFTHSVISDNPEHVFMFPGGGAQYAGMARDLYETEPVFADWMDKGLDILQPMLDYDIRSIWLPEPEQKTKAEERLKKPSVQLPLIMITEYALAQLWMAWGVKPAALVGHSMGENTAACVAGVMSFEDCIGLVHLRGKLFDNVPAGGMLSVPLPADELRPLLGDHLDLGAVNAPGLAVATGPQAALDELQERLAKLDVDYQRIPIDIAAHSRMLEPILKDFGDYLRSITLNPPKIPFTSNRSGTWITEAEATDPEYWVRHLRGTVHFADCIGTLAENPERIFIEVGPGKALASLTGQHDKVDANQVIGSLRHPDDTVADDAYFMAMLGRIWALGGRIDWSQIWGEAHRNRVPLPTYAFQRSSYFIEPGKAAAAESKSQWLMRSENPEDWGYRVAWTPRYANCDIDVTGDLTDTKAENWLIFADKSGLCDQVASRLRKAGHSVTTVTTGDAFVRTGDNEYRIAPERGREGYQALLADLASRDRSPTRIVHGWLLTQSESFRPGSSFFHRNLEQGFFSLFFLAQAIGEEDLRGPIHMNVLCSGALKVKDEGLPHPEKATLTGPARVIPREYPGITCGVLDVDLPQQGDRRKPPEISEDLSNQVLEDLLAEPGNWTAALRDGKRLEQGYRAQLLPDPVPEDLPLRDGGTYFITGGYGGIGLTLAEALIKRCAAKIVLLSRSGLPPRDQWPRILGNSSPQDTYVRRIRAIEQLEAAGGQIMTVTADVSNVEEMRAAIEQVGKEFGAINGVIHAAGLIDDAPIMTKSMMEIEDVFTPKVHGTQVIDQLFPDGSLDWLVLFSSTSTATAPIGQVDYVSANEYLNAYARSRSGDKTKVTAINWGIWSDVGMAADAMEARTGGTPAPSEPTDVPMLDEATFDRAGNRIFTATYNANNRWFLNEHRTKAGDALVPGTGYLEMATEALSVQGELAPFEIRDLYFLRPLAVSNTEHQKVRLRLPRSDVGYDFVVESAAEDSAFEMNAQASLSLMPLAEVEPIDISAIAARCAEARHAPEGGRLRSYQEAHLAFGPRWKVLTSTAMGQAEGLARLALTDDLRSDVTDGYQLHPGLMDLATGWAMALIEGYEPTHLWVPVSYRSIRVYQPLPAEIVSWVRNAGDNRADGEVASFDVTIATPDGSICVEVEGFSIRRMEDTAGFASSEATPAQSGELDTPAPLSPAEERLRHNLSQGILASEGPDLFFRALASDQSQVILSSLDLVGLVDQAGETTADNTGSDQKFQRPELDSDFVAPENDIEVRLAGFWQELLGVDQIGVEDSFFDLGGHSLIAVRLFAQIRKTYNVDFPISVLFEAPTIRKCAELIAARGVPKEGDEKAADDAPSAPERRFTHLVPMHSGEGGPKTPFFLVAGMFGNVLNLRHLAHLIGTDRPFYGLQARGLYGDEEPHRDLQEAARDYIAEIRQVQPRGPYMLGGFSGGGITAYEIAQQLTAAGEEVSSLVMLDTPLPVRPSVTRRDRMMIQLLELRERGPAYPVEWVKNRIAWEMQKRQPGSTAEADGQQFHDAAIEEAFLESVAAYPLKPWSGPLTLFRPPLVGKWQVAQDRLINHERDYITHDNDWTPWAPKIEVFEVPGDHDSMVLEPNVRVLASRMKRCLDEAEKRCLTPAS